MVAGEKKDLGGNQSPFHRPDTQNAKLNRYATPPHDRLKQTLKGRYPILEVVMLVTVAEPCRPVK